MCGIVACITQNKPVSEQELRIMASKINHRGPDAEGFYINNYVGLAHKRLSIIDLSSDANQPMISYCGRYVLVFNGEIYNYLELRKVLSKEYNIHFKTSSDTETILNGFAVWNTGVFDKICGMFAVVIYDTHENILFIARDRLGIKPLFYYHSENEFVFASEIKSIIAIGRIKNSNTLNYEALNAYLHLGYIPQPNTIFSNIHKFPAGCKAVIKNGQLEIEKYWHTDDVLKTMTNDNESQTKIELKNLLRKIINEHLICDVPFGSFLSGGIDSSLVSAIAAEMSEKKLHTFSIGFTESKNNESQFASKVASYLGTVHNELFVTENDARVLIPQLVDIYDEPFADSSAIPTYLVSKLSRQFVTMALSGDGGDELFLGYGAYIWARRLNNPLFDFTKNTISYVLSQMGSRYKRAAAVINFDERKTLKSHIFSQEQYFFSRNEIKNVLNPEIFKNFKLEESYNNFPRPLSVVEQQALFDINYYLKDDLLVKVDRASMQHALEVRVPLLDHRLVEFAINLNPNLRLKGKTTKYLLKQVLYDYLPQDLFNRPKMGFSVPLGKWMKNELKDYMTDYLSTDIINKHNILNSDEIQKLKKKFENPQYDYVYNRLWSIVVLNNFLEKSF